MGTLLIYSIKRVFSEGRELPNWRLSVIQGVHGRIVIKNDTHTGENLRSRQTLCASLLHPTSGLPIVEVPSMYDVHLLSLTGDELIVGFEAQWNGGSS